MKCVSCSEEISSKFKHAIESNMCPFCGSTIMPEDLKSNLIDLRMIMDEMIKSYPDNLKEFLLTNYDLVNRDFKNKLPRAPQSTVEPVVNELGDQVSGESVGDPEQIRLLQARAGVKPQGNVNKMRQLANQIKSGAVSADEVMSLSDETIEALDNEELSGMQQLVNSSLSGAINSMPEDNYDADSDIPPELLAMANKSSSPDYNAKDMARLNAIVQKSQKRNSAFGRQ